MILLLLAIAFAATVDFSGTWELDKEASDDFDALLKAQGASWAERKLAKGISVTQVITQSGDTVTVELQTTVKDSTHVLEVDGVPREITGPEGGTSTVTNAWVGEAMVTTTTGTDKNGNPVGSTVTRTLSDDGHTMTQTLEVLALDGKTYKADRIFRKK